MAKTRTPKADVEEKIIKENIQKRFKSIFSGQGEPLSNMSIQEVEALKNRISQLEAELTQQTDGMDRKSSPAQETIPLTMPVATSAARTTPKAHGVKFPIQSKITLWVGLCLILTMAVLTGYSVLTLRNSAIESAQQEAIAITEAETGKVKNQLEPALVAAKTMANSLAAVKAPGNPISLTRDQANGMLRKVAEENPTFLGTWTIWEPNAFDGLDKQFANTPLHDSTGRFIPYWVRNSTGKVEGVAVQDYETSGLNDYYSIPRQTKKDAIIPPFYYPVDGVDVMMTTMSAPIVENDRFYGVAGVDLRIDFVQSILDEINLYDGTATAVLLTDSGTLVAVRNRPDLALQSATVMVEDFEQIQSRLKAGEVFISQSPDGKYLRAFSPVKFGETDTSWYIGLIIPFEKITATATAAAVRQASIGLILLIVAMLLLWFLTGQVVKPVRLLTDVASAVARGNLDVVAQVKSNDEVGVLANVFNSMLYQLRDLFSTMEQRVAERTHDLELASEVGKTISEKVEDLTEMLTEAVEMIRARFDLYYTQIYLTDPSGKTITLQAGTGEAGKELLQRGHHLLINTASLNGRAATENRAVIVADTKDNPTFRPNPLLPKTRSEMSIPLMAGGKVVGVLDMQSEQPGALNESNLPAFEALAGQLAIAVENAALFEQAEAARREVEAQIRHLTEQGWQDFLDAMERGQKMGFEFKKSQVVRMESDALLTSSKDQDFSIPITVTGTKVGEIHLPVEQDHNWTPNEQELIKTISAQLGQHIENLRLLAQAERYRAEAEQAVRRLTHEGWDSFLHTHNELEPGYVFDLTEVKPLAEKNNGYFNYAVKQPMVVGDQVIGELAVDGPDQAEEAAEVIAAVAGQLSGHIENLRLSELNERHAQREQTLRQITSALRSSNNPATIMRTAVRELGSIMGRRTVVQLATPQESNQAQSAVSNSNESGAPAHQS